MIKRVTTLRIMGYEANEFVALENLTDDELKGIEKLTKIDWEDIDMEINDGYVCGICNQLYSSIRGANTCMKYHKQKTFKCWECGKRRLIEHKEPAQPMGRTLRCRKCISKQYKWMEEYTKTIFSSVIDLTKGKDE